MLRYNIPQATKPVEKVEKKVEATVKVIKKKSRK